MSDSDSSEDETRARLLESIDTSFLSNAMFKPKEVDSKEKKKIVTEKVPDKIGPTKTTPSQTDVPKSNRYLLEAESVLQSDINASESMKTHIAGKISKIIESMIEFEEVSSTQLTPTHKKSKKEDKHFGVRLLSSSKECVDLNNETFFVQQKPAPVRKRAIDVDDDETKPSLAEKVKSSVIDSDAIASEVQHWKAPRKRSTVFDYVQRPDGRCVAREDMPAANEFHKVRKQNRWDESKIRLFKKKSNKTQGVDVD